MRSGAWVDVRGVIRPPHSHPLTAVDIAIVVMLPTDDLLPVFCCRALKRLPLLNVILSYRAAMTWRCSVTAC